MEQSNSRHYIRALLLKTKSGAISWKKENDAHTSTMDEREVRLYPFHLFARDSPRLILEMREGYARKYIVEPDPHISALPLGKIKYYLAYLWNILFFGFMSVRLPPLQPETPKEIEDEEVRLLFQQLYSAITE